MGAIKAALNIIAKIISYIMAIVLLFSICCVDTEGTYIFYILIAISMTWLTVHAYLAGVLGNTDNYY